MKCNSFIIFLLFTIASMAQVGGEQVFNFLSVPTSARQSALGGKTLVLEDVNQALWNPAMIGKKMDNQFAVNYKRFLADINYGSLSYAQFVSRRFGVIQGGITYVDYGKLIAADEQGNETGTFKARDIAVSVGYAYNIPRTYLYFGANFKLISSVIDNFTSNGLAFDFGLSYLDDDKPYKATIVLRNIGYQVNTFNSTREPLPFEVLLGGSYQVAQVPLRWYFTLDNLQKWQVSAENPSDTQVSFDGGISNNSIKGLSNAFRHLIIGAEFFPETDFNIRLGYNVRRARELRLTSSRTFSGLTAGFGIKMRWLKFNYAFSKFHPATNANTFSLIFDLSRSGF
ncbi:MAG: type IX secretion system protein PorQ [Flavobacteriales bacterium]|jgi:hypothetical protein|nr:type IX secretion system protein PorQ [Flavobacteriales bacterium]